jgi:ADP-heptose:LPS heptosyltransferase
VLFHFDGGWDLKIYPVNFQKRLLRAVREAGFEVSVLTDREGAYDCPTHRFKSLEQLRGLITEHSIFVGMDSFPAHYAAHVLFHSTICLFSSTRPENSNQLESDSYRFLSKGMTCSPCLARSQCPIYRKDYCSNFVEPEQVLGSIHEMFQRNYLWHPQTTAFA